MKRAARVISIVQATEHTMSGETLLAIPSLGIDKYVETYNKPKCDGVRHYLMLGLAQVQNRMGDPQDPFLQQGPPPCPLQLDDRVPAPLLVPLGRTGGITPGEPVGGRAGVTAPEVLECHLDACHLMAAGRVGGRVWSQAGQRYALLQDQGPQEGPGVIWVGVVVAAARLWVGVVVAAAQLRVGVVGGPALL